MLAVFGAALLSAAYLLVLSVGELGHLKTTIAEIDEEAARARQFRDLIDKMSQSILSFTAVALDLSIDERLAVLTETDAYFAEFSSAVDNVKRSTSRTLAPEQQTDLAEALDAVAHSWEEIRDQFDTGMEQAAKAYHFLQITDEVRIARKILVAMEASATRTADQATSQAIERLEASAGFLIKVVLAVAATSLCALLGMGGFALATRQANRTLSQALRELEQRDAALAVQNERFEAALRNMSQGLCMFDAQERLIVANEHFGATYRLPQELVRPGTTLDELASKHVTIAGGSGNDSDSYACVVRSLIDGAKPGTTTHELSDGRAVEIWFQPMQGGGWVTTFEDITERRQAEAQIAHMARHDALTGLGNRALFRDEMKRALLRVGRGDKVGVLCLDLDRFKIVNDTLGHPVGDALLQAVSDRLQQCVREVDTVVRLGGDEFAIIVVDAAQPEASVALAKRLLETISAPYEIDDQKLNIGTSIGIAVAPDDGRDPDRLLKSADMALYRAKEDGRGTVRLFEPE
ncbi:MAG: diguanylate cyclase, partial [Alphaproteobacteria bacterium]|nr:diguanylate cyclase [Alphaproteobacteria bacterium]